MKCLKTVRWLRENPGKPATEGLKDHAAGCPDCRKVLAEQLALDASLRGLPAIEPPSFFETRIKAAVLGERGRTAPARRPLLAPMAALLVLTAASAFFVAKGGGPSDPVSLKPPAPAIPKSPEEKPAVITEPTPVIPTAIYPVWPGDGDVVADDDVSIMASLYPAPPPGTVISMKLNDRDVSGRVRAEGELLSFDPGRMEPGRHVVTITLREADGGERSLTYSFFALEARS